MKHFISTCLLGITSLLGVTFTLTFTSPLFAQSEQQIESILSKMTLDEKIAIIHAQSKFSSPGVPRLGVPGLWCSDGPHGVRAEVLWDEWNQAGWTSDSCVAFPALTCLAATWNPAISRVYGENLAEEALYRGKNVMLGPGVNIYRTPLNGRNFEYMGEDPYLASRMVVPYVQGVQSKGVAACVKHFALNNQETYRHLVDVKVSDRALYEIYLPAFKAAVVEGQAWSIMGSYNRYKGQYNCHNEILLNRILRDEWGFDGAVISDWGGCQETPQAITNGLDLEFGTWTDGLTMGATNSYDIYYLAKPYKKLIQEGKVGTKELDEKVRNVLRLILRTSMNPNKGFGSLHSDEHYAAARQIATEGIVLLKNDKGAKNKDKGLLPITPLQGETEGATILVVGENAILPLTVGGGSSSLKVQREISPLQGITERAAKEGIRVDFARGYAGVTRLEQDKMTVDLAETRSAEELRAEAVTKAKEASVVIFVGGLNKSGNQDCEGVDRLQYELPYGQNELIEALYKTNPNLVVVNISGNAVAMPWVKKVPAILQAWYLGSEAGHAIADVLFGDVNPSGKMPYSIFPKLTDYPSHQYGELGYPGVSESESESESEYKVEEYKEDVFVGYRYADKAKLTPVFPFGHGLSYTTFEVESESESESVKVKVKNTGKVAGAEVIQVYVGENKPTVARPVKELKAFEKVYLEPGESKTITITLDPADWGYWDEAKHAFVTNPGKYTIYVGTSSRNIVWKKDYKLTASAANRSKAEVFVDNLMRQMTFEEKLGQLNLLPVNGEIVTGSTVGEYNLGDRIAKGEVGGLFNLKGVDKIREAQRIAVEQSRLGIPLIFGMDVIHGYETVFPIPLALSCSWDTAAIRQSAKIAAKEATADGICWTFSPMVDICLDARWGRISEGNGEDPFLGSAIAKAMVKGYQGKDLTDSQTMMACVKHFALYGGVEAGREYNTVDMSEYRMANDYLPPYKAAVDAGCGSVMAAFNTINGLPCHCNQWLLTDLLRKQWNFGGFVVTDYTGILELIAHRMGPDLETVGARALEAGCDMDMVSEALTIQKNRKAVDAACRRVLMAKYQLGLFDDPYRYCDDSRRATDIYTAENRAQARQLATESFVLLKNTPSAKGGLSAKRSFSEAVLPLQKDAKVALIGPLADTRANMAGTWSVAATFDYKTVREAFEEALPKGHLFYAKGSNIEYSQTLQQRGELAGRSIWDERTPEQMRQEALDAARKAEVIVLAMGETSEMSGESASRTHLTMPKAQQDLIDELATLHKPMVLLNFSGRPVVLTHESEVCDAILQVWFGGSETADAITDVVFGKVSPSGKLTTSFPRSVGQEPLYYRQFSTGRPVEDGEFVKYRSCYLDENNLPLYPFGYGLSYTTFEVESESESESESVKVKVKNTGKMAGAEVVQLYVRAQNSTLARPVKELRGFKRVYLEPGEETTVTFDINEEAVGYYTDLQHFVVEKGLYDIYINSTLVGTIEKN